MSARLKSLVAIVAAFGSMFSLVELCFSEDLPADLCFFYRSNGCNGGGTGDIQAPGVDDISYPRSQSVKCYKN